MSSTREKMGQVSLKPCKFFLFSSSSQSSDLLTTAVKVGFLVFFLVSLALVVYSFFTSQSCWFLECQDLLIPAISTTSPAICAAPDDPDFEPTTISHIVFGIGGSALTWGDRNRYSRLWWQPNVTRGFVWLDKEPGLKSLWSSSSDDDGSSTPPYRISSDWTRFKHSSSPSAVRLARIVVDSFRAGLPGVRWFVMGDDDTVFFTENLVTVLGKYNHRRMCYVGGNSESVEQDDRHSFDMAFGGGGFAISYPLAAKLVRVMDGCLNRYYKFYGSDERVWACVKELGVSLTMERGFHQIDVRGDLFGLLTAHPLVPLVSLHHLDYVKSLFPNMSQYDSLRHLLQAYHSDPPQIVQQCFCHHLKFKWSVSISWGYAVQVYPSLLSVVELEKPLQTFSTWRSWQSGPFVFNTRPVNSDPCERPFVYYLESISETGQGGTVTTYNRTMAKPEKWCRKHYYDRAITLRRILVSASKMDPEEWKSPRRRCCEIESVKNGAMKVTIRSCEE
ncbi:OLC1v1027742C1 [Oldenlandia corymbosa var. corymbosa]|uniref:OLC1v1027742C1 n=1 Tax=Oldenlandia corymbosa var. corymbosa TaxID=529605 RepID=A0AAV1CC59_OLDCO|nr:OLC1v1027742C1 [Oldenlandia corymbosa var. corymbosa]